MSGDEAVINIVLTGVVGSGKSTACNFFLREQTFKAGISFKPITVETDFGEVLIKGELTKFVDTPGLLDPYDKSEVEFKRIAQAILAVPNGIHALGIVINLGGRISAEDVKVFEQLLMFIELIPYTFIIFSNANLLKAQTPEDQKHRLKSMINNAPKILRELLEHIDNRYIILESVLNKDEGYYATKVDELIGIVDSIRDEKKRPFTCFINDIAKRLLESNASREECIYALMTDLQETKDKLHTMKANGRKFWQTLFVGVAAAVGAAVGASVGALIGMAAGPPGSATAGTVGATFGASAVATIIGAGASGSVGGAIGYGTGAGVNKMCGTQ